MKRLYLLALVTIIPLFGISQTVDEINKPVISGLDEVAPFHEGLAAVRKGNQWGFMDKEGVLVIAFRDDVLSNSAESNTPGVSSIGYPKFKEGLCIILQPTNEGIPLYGFMNTKGETVIEPQFVNISPFEDAYTVGIFVRKSLRGKNEFQLEIYDYSFTEVLVNKAGEMVWPIQERQNILMNKKRFKIPELHAKLLSNDLLAVKEKDNQWKVVQVALDGD